MGILWAHTGTIGCIGLTRIAFCCTLKPKMKSQDWSSQTITLQWKDSVTKGVPVTKRQNVQDSWKVTREKRTQTRPRQAPPTSAFTPSTHPPVRVRGGTTSSVFLLRTQIGRRTVQMQTWAVSVGARVRVCFSLCNTIHQWITGHQS